MPAKKLFTGIMHGGEVKHLKTDMDVAPKVPFGHAKEFQRMAIGAMRLWIG